VELGAPLPPPVESTTPPPYITPGIENAKGPDGLPLVDPSAIAAHARPQPPLPETFKPQGPIFGAPAGRPATAVLQALKPALLVIHGADGSVYFARQLAEGEAYRIPQLGGLVIDVSEPDAFQLFVGGQSKGVLPAPLTPVSKLASPPPPARSPVPPKATATGPTGPEAPAADKAAPAAVSGQPQG
jgi:hypothetical protein